MIFFFFFYIFFYFFFFTEPRKGHGGAISYNFFSFFLTLILFNSYVPSGASYFYFLTSRKLYHMKFAIFDVARCRMGATSLTFWLVILLHPNVELYCFKCHSVTKIKYGHPLLNKVINRSQNTVHKVTYLFNVQSVRIFGRILGLFIQS